MLQIHTKIKNLMNSGQVSLVLMPNASDFFCCIVEENAGAHVASSTAEPAPVPSDSGGHVQLPVEKRKKSLRER